MTRWHALLGMLLGGWGGGCEAQPQGLPEGTCRVVLWSAAASDQPPAVIGSWDDWTQPTGMRRYDHAWWVADFGLAPGEYEYLVVTDGRAGADPHNALTTFRASDGAEVSLLQVADCTVPGLNVQETRDLGEGTVAISLQLRPARDGSALDPSRLEVSEGTLEVEQVDSVDEQTQAATVHVRSLSPGKHRLDLRLEDADGREARSAATVWVDAAAPMLQDHLIYQVMIDRFRGDGGEVLEPPASPGGRAGGTLDGVIAELQAGTFDALGVSALWLSPAYLNPDEAREGSDGHMYEGYHGYWPLQSRSVDPRIGGEAALSRLVEAAHDRGIAVLLDIVPNHLYEDNPLVAQHRDAGWFHEHDPLCVCGTPSCPWHLYIQECWFTPYLPDLRHQNPVVLQQVVEDARWWAATFDLDGFRIDAVPMMPRAVTRRIVHAIRTEHGPRSATVHLGEIFTGPGAGGTEIIRYYLGPDGLDSAFDFPLMWVVRDVIAHRRGGFEAVEASLNHTADAIDGSTSVMARIIGNHDVTRFISEARGDAGADGWGDSPPVQPDASEVEVYAAHRLALGLLLTLDGIPVVYYGDEVGLAGGADPDNRRVMPDLDLLLQPQADILELTRRLGTLRRCMPALRRGDRTAVVVEPDRYAFVRDARDDAPAVVLVSRELTASIIELRASRLPDSVPVGRYVDVLTGESFEVGTQNDDIAMPAQAIRVLVPFDHPCR